MSLQISSSETVIHSDAALMAVYIFFSNATQWCRCDWASSLMECRQAAAQTWPRCAHLSACWRAGALRDVCVGPLLAWLPAEPRQELAQREEVFINVYWSSQENLTNRTAVAASQRQSNKGHCAFLKHMRCQMDTHMATDVYTCVFLHAHIHIKVHRLHLVPEQKVGLMFS